MCLIRSTAVTGPLRALKEPRTDLDYVMSARRNRSGVMVKQACASPARPARLMPLMIMNYCPEVIDAGGGTMKITPILVKAEMILAILDRQKTQTRRIINSQPIALTNDETAGPRFTITLRCPYGRSGDLLWVRESWAIHHCGNRVSLSPEAWPDGWPVKRLRYVATDAAPSLDEENPTYWWNKRQSIHMPRWASRLTLRITNVYVKRVQNISGEDAVAEGWPGTSSLETPLPPLVWFRSLWDSINAKRGFGWDTNPWVWVIEFEVIKQNIDTYLAMTGRGD